ncbi:histidine kinase [Sphingobium faniae]|nr:histidine kinase [Sphingobium faniae]
MPTLPAIIQASISADGILLSADEPLLALQREAGGDLGERFAIPQLAAVARLAMKLGVAVSRPVTAASARHDIDMWVRAKPESQAVHLSVIDWQERPVFSASNNSGLLEADLAAVSDGWNWQVDTQLRFQMVLEGGDLDGALPAQPPVPGSPFSSYFQLQVDEDGDMAILRGFTQRRAFRNQLACLMTDPARRFHLSGFPLFDLTGQLLGYRGKAFALDLAVPVPEIAPPAAVDSLAFGKRLDRSLRQPLGRIIANADTISAQLEGPLRSDYAGYALDIASAGRHLMALVDDLADLQAIDRPDFTIASEAVDLADLGRRAAGLLGVKALDRQIHVLAPAMDEIIPARGEFRRVLQILVNLIGNAIRYGPEGSEVRVETGLEDGLSRIAVTDQGSGIGPDDRERIFEKFERLGRDDQGGSGLGLYISRRLARAMGGDIRIEGEAGQGARFILTLPLDEESGRVGLEREQALD